MKVDGGITTDLSKAAAGAKTGKTKTRLKSTPASAPKQKRRRR